MQKMKISIDKIEPIVKSWGNIGITPDYILISINFIDTAGIDSSVPMDTSIIDLMEFITGIIKEKHYQTYIGTPSSSSVGCRFIGYLGYLHKHNETNLRLLILRPASKYHNIPVSTYYWLDIPFLDFVDAVAQLIEDLKIEMEKRKDPKLAEKDKIGYERFMVLWNETLEAVEEWKQQHDF